MVQGEKLCWNYCLQRKIVRFKKYIGHILKKMINLQNDVELKPGKNFGIHSLGRKRSLVINKCTPEDAGTYICRTTDDNTSAKLTVQGNY